MGKKYKRNTITEQSQVGTKNSKKKKASYMLVSTFNKQLRINYPSLSLPLYTQKNKTRILKNMKDLIANLGFDKSNLFIEMCVCDWKSIRSKLMKESKKSLCEFPSLIDIYCLKDNIDILNAAISKKGIIFGVSRVSKFALNHSNYRSEKSTDLEDWYNG